MRYGNVELENLARVKEALRWAYAHGYAHIQDAAEELGEHLEETVRFRDGYPYRDIFFEPNPKKPGSDFLGEALNSGDGSYRP